MRIVTLALALVLGGCAELQNIQKVYTVVSESTVPARAVIVAANAFDALEGTATQYLIYCRPNLSQPVCSANNRRTVIRAVRSGRAARNQLETYIDQKAPAPAQIYNVLIAAINGLNASAAATMGAVR